MLYFRVEKPMVFDLEIWFIMVFNGVFTGFFLFFLGVSAESQK